MSEFTRPQVFASRELLNGAKARTWLAMLGPNRNKIGREIARLAQDMVAGRYKENGETIIFDWNDQVLDGQNRIYAADLADRLYQELYNVVWPGVYVLVARNVDPTTFSTIDQGAMKTVAHIHTANKEKNATALASGNAWFVRIEERKSAWNATRITPRESLAVLERHPMFRQSTDFICKQRSLRNLMRQSAAIYCHYRASMTDPAKADEFFQRLADGQGLQRYNPIYELRERLTRNAASKKKMREQEVIALAIKAWNAFLNGREIRLLQWRYETDKNKRAEQFPEWEELTSCSTAMSKLTAPSNTPDEAGRPSDFFGGLPVAS